MIRTTFAPSSQATLDELFPLPSLPPSTLAPARIIGFSHESGETLRNLLKDNHERWHIFFNEQHFHNHASHHLIAIYALGAPPSLIEAAYPTHTAYQRPSFASANSIDRNNFATHLGDDSYYQAYRHFFAQVLLEGDVASVLEEFLFSAKMNFNAERKGKPQPEMLNRFVSGVFHPLIHVGYGVEFGLKGMLAEGLAQAASQAAEVSVLIPESFFTSDTVGSRATAAVRSLASKSTSQNTTATSSPHLFSILARMLKDPRLALNSAIKDKDPASQFIEVLKRGGETIREYAEKWTIDENNAKEVEAKIEELSWAHTLIYGVGGWRAGKEFSADFFTMHHVTSTIFLPSFMPYLTPASQSALLRAYLVVALTWWIARGRPGFAIAEFFASTSAAPTPPGAQPTPDAATLAPANLAPNAWLAVLQTTVMHPNEHLCKLQRTLAHFAAAYGTRAPGHFAGTGLAGAEQLDGTLFIRVAGLTADRLGWMREAQAQGTWDFEGFFHDA